MKKVFLLLVLTFGLYNIFAVRFDILGALSYRNINFSGVTDSGSGEVDFNSNCNTFGINFGLDLFFTRYFGLYTRLGFYSVDNIKRTVGNTSDKLKGGSSDYSMSFDLGTSFALPLNDYFSVCLAPAFSMNYVDKSTYQVFTRAAIDSYLGYGITGDIYLKFRYKHFTALAGCAGSVLPWCVITSKDTATDYSYNVRNTFGFGVRPYIGAGVAL